MLFVLVKVFYTGSSLLPSSFIHSPIHLHSPFPNSLINSLIYSRLSFCHYHSEWTRDSLLQRLAFLSRFSRLQPLPNSGVLLQRLVESVLGQFGKWWLQVLRSELLGVLNLCLCMFICYMQIDLRNVFTKCFMLHYNIILSTLSTLWTASPSLFPWYPQIRLCWSIYFMDSVSRGCVEIVQLEL